MKRYCNCSRARKCSSCDCQKNINRGLIGLGWGQGSWTTSKKMLPVEGITSAPVGRLSRIGNSWKQSRSATLSSSPLLDKNTGSRPGRRLEGLLILLAKKAALLLVATKQQCLMLADLSWNLLEAPTKKKAVWRWCYCLLSSSLPLLPLLDLSSSAFRREVRLPLLR